MAYLASAFEDFIGGEEVKGVDLSTDSVYIFDAEEQERIGSQRPWAQDPTYFKRVEISAIALVKMVTHAAVGGDLEVMGMMLGKVHGQTMYVLDAFELPVEGTETRVNAQDEGNEYMVEYVTKARQVGRLENVIGWYHSHPGYRCWLSGIDVETQAANQAHQDPFLAIVDHPGYSRNSSSAKALPENKAKDFGTHANRQCLSVNTEKLVSIVAKLRDVKQHQLGEDAATQNSNAILKNKGLIKSIVKESKAFVEELKHGIRTDQVKSAVFNNGLQGKGAQ
ncbi:COP9 signalosome catalytic subunit rri1 [Spiromyces aspiralis]|uniref:COP9 signalosome catalytic subunit rri1 n=1 Tax=Spiromyces aspiralis TaxID=68401 RepID=A0ACC1HR29_9FUNG|nr:COP9 signalosome catalytic subunit rri1 [Spiromyces aspiralis]